MLCRSSWFAATIPATKHLSCFVSQWLPRMSLLLQMRGAKSAYSLACQVAIRIAIDPSFLRRQKVAEPNELPRHELAERRLSGFWPDPVPLWS